MRSHFEVTPAEYERQRQGHLQRRRVAMVAHDVAHRVQPGDLVLEVGMRPGRRARRDRAGPSRGSISGPRRRHGDDRVCDGGARRNEYRVRADRRRRDADPDRAQVVFGIDVLHHVHALDASSLDRGDARAGRRLDRGRAEQPQPVHLAPSGADAASRARRGALSPRLVRRAVEGAGLRVVERSTAFVVPGAVGSVPVVVERLESLLERVPVLGGSVVYRISPA